MPVKVIHQSVSRSLLSAVRMASGTYRDLPEMAQRSPNGVGKFIPFTGKQNHGQCCPFLTSRVLKPTSDRRSQMIGNISVGALSSGSQLWATVKQFYSLQLYPNVGEIELLRSVGVKEANEKLPPNRLLQLEATKKWPCDCLHRTIFQGDHGTLHQHLSPPVVVFPTCPLWRRERLPSATVEPYCMPETIHFTYHFL